MLMNVTSARIDIKIAAGRAERVLERYAEPMAALHGAAWPERLLELAWRRVVDNSAHDSICGCSQDAVVTQVLTRFAEAEQIGRGLLAAAIRPLAAATPARLDRRREPVTARSDGPRRPRSRRPAGWSAVELELDDGRRVATQLVERPETVLRRLTMTGRQVPELFARRLHGRELFGHSLDGHTILRDGPAPELILRVDDPAAPPDFDVDTILDAVQEATAADPDEPWQVTVVRGDRRRLLAAVPAPAARGGRRPRGRGRPGRSDAAAEPDADAVRVGEREIANGQRPRRDRGRRHPDDRGRRGAPPGRRAARRRRRLRRHLQLRSAGDRPAVDAPVSS